MKRLAIGIVLWIAALASVTRRSEFEIGASGIHTRAGTPATSSATAGNASTSEDCDVRAAATTTRTSPSRRETRGLSSRRASKRDRTAWDATAGITPS